MIAVIADDFTGAAEIGGIGLRRGMKVIIETEVSGQNDADLLVIATDTRSMSVDDATQEIDKVTRQLLMLSPRFIFKKLDSVLRGHIYEELISQQRASGMKRVVLVPANPHFNRIIRDGIYLVNGIPLAETSFSADPEFPLRVSDVRVIVGGDARRLVSANWEERLPDSGLIIGNVTDKDDLSSWAEKIDESTMAAGGSGFFEALLQKDFPDVRPIPFPEPFTGKNVLFIFGSTYPKDMEVMDKIRDIGVVVFNLDEQFFYGPDRQSILSQWAAKIAAGIQSYGKVALTTVFRPGSGPISPTSIRAMTGRLVREIFELVPVDDLFIEGGATAFRILTDLRIRRLVPYREFDFGIIQMVIPGNTNLHITTKPGSYVWPEFLLKKNVLN
ncbi:MAG: four-carbon acid sugar kinase family protein [Mangrovibacterium sp.]